MLDKMYLKNGLFCPGLLTRGDGINLMSTFSSGIQAYAISGSV